MITVKQRGSTKNTMHFLKRILKKDYLKNLEKYAELGVKELAAATPVRTGATAAAWSYVIEVNNQRAKITWTNSNVNDGANIALLLQYGHGTRSGTYVQGVDYINPAMKPLFQRFADELWKEVVG